MNPFEAPRSVARVAENSSLSLVGTITSRFRLTPEHLSQMAERFRSQKPGHKFWRSVRKLGGVRFLPSAILLAIAIALLYAQQYITSAVILAYAIYLTMVPLQPVTSLARRISIESPHENAALTIILTDEGVTISGIEETEVPWTGFAKAVIFDDGVLFYLKNHAILWVSDVSLDDNDAAIGLRKLAVAKLPTRQATT